MEYYTTIGADVSDRTTKVCVMTKAEGGERRIVVETTCATTKAGFEEAFAKFDRSWPVVFETGTHCRWMDRLFRKMGFKTIVGNPGKIPSITKSNTKNDRNDARELARLALADPAMLHPVFLRDEVYQQMLRFHHARNMLISQRTQTINQIRGFAKSMGHRIECSSTEKFHEQGKADWPRELEECAWPLMGSLKTINLKIKAYDRLIERLAERPECKQMGERVRVVYGVGIVGSTVFVAAIGGRPDRFDHARDIGAYLGMIPKQDQSGDDDKQLHIVGGRRQAAAHHPCGVGHRPHGARGVRGRGDDVERERHGPQAQGASHCDARRENRKEEGESRRGEGACRDDARHAAAPRAGVRPAVGGRQEGI